MVDPHIELGSGLRRQLARHGYRADLAITVDAARACIGHKHYQAMVVVADLSKAPARLGLQQLRDGTPQTWMVVLASTAASTVSQTAVEIGADAYLLRPFRFSDLLLRLASFAHYARGAAT